MLGQLRRTLGEYNFAGQYQQTSSPQGTVDEASNCGPYGALFVPIPE
jgi:hypothetical protein